MTSCGHSKQEHDSVLICLTCAAARDKAARELRDAADVVTGFNLEYPLANRGLMKVMRNLADKVAAFDRAYSGGGE